MKRLLFLLLLLLSVFALLACNKSNDTDGGETLGISVILHNGDTTSGKTFSGYTSNSVSVPNMPGNTFLGYYTADNVQYFDASGNQISGMMIADGMHFYAKFEPYKYTIEFMAQSGYFEDNTTEKSVTVSYGDDLSQLIPNVYTLNPKYELDGYYDELGTRRYTNGTVAEFSLDNLGNGETLKLHAKFKVRELTVTLNYNDGVSWNDKITVKYGEKIGDLSAYRKADGDMEIATWSTSHMYEQPLPEAITEDITIFAMWRKYVFADFMYPGNVIKSQKVYVADGKSCILPSSDVAGYKLQGWYDNAELSGNPVGNVYQSELKSIYYGKWTDARYIITFNTDGGNSFEAIEYSYGDTVKLPMNVKKYGYLFKSWSIKGKDGLFSEITPDMWGNLELNAVYDSEFIPIFNENDLKNIANNPEGKYFLANDITLTENWVSIPELNGVLDGNSFTIHNMTIVKSTVVDVSESAEGSPAFIHKNNGTIRNLSIKNAFVDYSITSNRSCYPSAGILTLVNDCGEILNCRVYDSEIKASFYAAQYSDLYVGAISAGNGANGNIEGCFAECVITASTSGQARLWIGGISSYSYNTINNCASDIVCNATSGTDLHIGGTVGVLCRNALITNCFANIEATRNGQVYAAGVYQTNNSDNTARVTNSFTNHSLEKAKATSPDYVYNSLGWDKEIWEVTEGEYPRLR